MQQCVDSWLCGPGSKRTVHGCARRVVALAWVPNSATSNREGATDAVSLLSAC